jgi:hypothetical protein
VPGIGLGLARRQGGVGTIDAGVVLAHYVGIVVMREFEICLIQCLIPEKWSRKKRHGIVTVAPANENPHIPGRTA